MVSELVLPLCNSVDLRFGCSSGSDDDGDDDDLQ